MYFVPHDKRLVDGVHFATDLSPDFDETEGDEEIVSVRIESEEDASSEGSRDDEEGIGESAESSEAEK